MSKKQILIAYGTRYGTTEATVQDMVKMFSDLEIRTELLDLKQIKEKEWPSLDKYNGIIVASGIKIGKWMKKTLRFLKKFKDEIEFKEKTIGLFVSCMKCLTDPIKAKEEYLEKVIDDLGIKPKIYQAFGPILDFSESSRMGKFMKAILKKAAKDDLESDDIKIDYKAKNDLRKIDQIQKFVEKFTIIIKGE